MPKLPHIRKTYRHLARYRQVARVLVKYGFGDLLQRIRLWEQIHIERRIFRRPAREYAQLTFPERLRLALEELGPTFVKLGQMLSTRPDLVPHEFIIELKKLQNRVAPMSTQAAKRVIESDLGQTTDELFASFHDEPLAAGSLAQVHRASLKGGEVVAVKVQRPEVEHIVEVDLEIARNLAVLMERHIDVARQLRAVALMREFSSNIRKELDFRTEASNMRRFANNFAGDPEIHVPTLFQQLCTRRVLVMEYIEGINVSETERLVAEGYDLSLLARHGADISLKSALEHGFFHADPHPGNIVILPGNVICLLDYGMMGSVSWRQRESLAKLAYTIVSGNDKAMPRALLRLAEVQDVVDVDRLEADMSDIVQQYVNLPHRELCLGPLLYQLLRLLMAHNLRFQTHLIWMFKALATAEDTVRELDAEFDFLEYSRPYAQQVLRNELSPLRQARELYFIVTDALEMVKDLPYELQDILRLLKTGRIKVEFEHMGLEPLRQTLDHLSNRIAMSIILAALLIGSSLIVLSGLPPHLAGMPVIGLAGYIIAGVLGLWLVISILRTGSM